MNKEFSNNKISKENSFSTGSRIIEISMELG